MPPQNKSEEARVTYHYDPHGKEWVVRLHGPHAEASVCGCPGVLEARLVSRALTTALAVCDTTFTIHKSGDKKRLVELNNPLEFDELRAEGLAFWKLVLEMLDM